jgi:hypothetical protein
MSGAVPLLPPCCGWWYLLTLLPSFLQFPSLIFVLPTDLSNCLSAPFYIRTVQVNICKGIYCHSKCCRMYVLLHVLLTVNDICQTLTVSMCYCMCCWQLMTSVRHW